MMIILDTVMVVKLFTMLWWSNRPLCVTVKLDIQLFCLSWILCYGGQTGHYATVFKLVTMLQ